MEKIEIKFRSWYKGIECKPTKLEVPGWAGDLGHKDGDKPQPYHCPPFIDGATYGLDLTYPFDTECVVKNENGKIIFEGDFSKEAIEGVTFPPFMAFAPNHFGFTSSLDIIPPSGYIIRLEPHPRFYCDTTGTVPLAIVGHIQSEWWPKVFFVVFKSPYLGQKYIFRKNEPYAQILVLPKKVIYDVKRMTPEEASRRSNLENKINHKGKYLAEHSWSDHLGYSFDDKYKVLSRIFAKDGLEGINKALNDCQENTNKYGCSLISKKTKHKILKVKK